MGTYCFLLQVLPRVVGMVGMVDMVDELVEAPTFPPTRRQCSKLCDHVPRRFLRSNISQVGLQFVGRN